MSTLNYSCKWSTAGITCPHPPLNSATSLASHVVTHFVKESVGGATRWYCRWENCQIFYRDGRKAKDSLVEHLLTHNLFSPQTSNGTSSSNTIDNSSSSQDQQQAALSSNITPESSSSSHGARPALDLDALQPSGDLDASFDLQGQQQPSAPSNTGDKAPRPQKSRTRRPGPSQPPAFPPEIVRPSNAGHPATNKRFLPQNLLPPPSPSGPFSCDWKIDGKRCSATFENSVDVVQHVGSVHLVHKPAHHHSWRCLWGTCRSTFPKRRALVDHITSHFAITLYHCPHCRTPFSNKSLLRIHQQLPSLTPHCPAPPPVTTSQTPSPAVFIPAPLTTPYTPMPAQNAPLPPLSSSHLPISFPRSYYTS